MAPSGTTAPPSGQHSALGIRRQSCSVPDRSEDTRAMKRGLRRACAVVYRSSMFYICSKQTFPGEISPRVVMDVTDA
jgi:hypothetical protein